MGKSLVLPLISDHNPVKLEIRIPKNQKNNQVRRMGRLIKNIDQQSFSEEFNQSHIEVQDNLEKLVISFEKELVRVIDTLAPLKELKCKLRKNVPWFDRETLEVKRQLRNLEDKWHKYQLESIWSEYLTKRREYVNLIRRKKRTHFSNRVMELKGDSKALHELINALTGSRKVNPLPDSNSDQKLAEDFAEFFINKIQKIRDDLKEYPLFNPPHNDTIPEFKFNEMSEDQVRKLVFEMKTKHCELDQIPTKLLKTVWNTIGPILTNIVNISLLSGDFCNHWKIALVKPLLKKVGLELIKSNYRPVSNLTFISKVVEKCMLKQLSCHYEMHNLLPEYQSAYRKGFSCETLLLKMTNSILWSMENKTIASTAICDLSAAFDTVDNRVMRTVLRSKFGVNDDALKWFQNYLSPRQMQVQIGTSRSNIKTFDFSVPQGSAAGANLFNLYSSTFADIIPQELNLNGFADDHSMMTFFNPKIKDSEIQAREKLENALSDTKDWMNSVRLKMNDSKTEFIYFGNSRFLRSSQVQSLSVNDVDVPRTDCVRLLGAWLDSALGFKNHVQQKSKKALSNLFRLKKIRNYLTQDACETLVLSLCISHIDYANCLLSGLPQTTISVLQRVQNMCAKLVLKRTKYDSNSQIVYCVQMSQQEWSEISKGYAYPKENSETRSKI